MCWPEIKKFIRLPPPNALQQNRGQYFKEESLTHDKRQRDECVNGFVLVKELFDPATQKIENQKEIKRD